METKLNVTAEFEMPDGSFAKRSCSEDVLTVRTRIIFQVAKAVGAMVAKEVVSPCYTAYNNGDYEHALLLFSKAAELFPDLSWILKPHIRICKRVAAVKPSTSDQTHLDQVQKWENSSRLGRLFGRRPPEMVRCKYCGHFTPYIHPDHGFAYLDSNNCLVCSRGYPVPDFGWDSVDGQAYIYYRNSVTEPEFYTEFEQQFDVYPDHTFFVAKSP